MTAPTNERLVPSDAAERLRARLAPVGRRIRIDRAIRFGAIPLGAACVVVAIGAIARFALRIPIGGFALAAVAAASVAWAVLLGRRVTVDESATRADESHDLDDRLGTAVALARKPEPTEFERAAIADAISRATIDHARAVPYSLPRNVPIAALLLVAAIAATFIPLPPLGTTTSVARASETRRVLDEDTIAATRDELERMRRESRGHEIEADLAALEAVLDAIEHGTIDAEEAFRRLDEIGRRVAMEPRSEARNAALETAANALGDRSERLEAALDAMRAGDAQRAAAAMAELAQAMREGGIDRRELDRIRESFERMAEAARARQERRDELLRRREELRRELEEESEPSLLERHRRELERLERELEQLEEQRRELERLERELEEAAEDLNRNDSSAAADDLQQAFEDLNRMANESMDESERRELEEQMEQLREAMRRQRESQAGGEQESSGGGSSGSGGMQRYRLRAGGNGRRVVIVGPSGGGSQGGEGSEGQSGSEGGQPGGQGGQPGGQGGQGGQPGEGSGDGPLVLQLTPGGEGAQAILELPNGGRPSSRSGPGGSPGRDSSGAGTDHDAQTMESPTDLESSGETSHVEGEDSEGETRSQVIRGAAASGFAGRGYRSVHTDYADHAEEILDRENVPPGYQYYVRRYFQLIRPREEANP